MFKNEDFERLLVRYTAQGIPAGETLQHFCDHHKVPYNLFNKWYRDTRHKVVKVVHEDGRQVFRIKWEDVRRILVSPVIKTLRIR